MKKDKNANYLLPVIGICFVAIIATIIVWFVLQLDFDSGSSGGSYAGEVYKGIEIPEYKPWEDTRLMEKWFEDVEKVNPTEWRSFKMKFPDAFKAIGEWFE